MRAIFLTLFLFPSLALAQQMPRTTDTVLSRDALVTLLRGHMLEFYTGGFARYGVDGGYDYRYEIDGAPAPGRYEVREDGMVCVLFHNGFDRCDLIVRAGERYVMIIDNGERYPVKAITTLP